MSDLEKAQRKANEVGGPNAPSPESTAGESTASSSTHLLSSEYESDLNPPDLSNTTAGVQDWLTKARQSMEVFGEYLRLDNPEVAKSPVLEEVAGENEQSTRAFHDDLGDEGSSDINEKRRVGSTTSGVSSRKFPSAPPRGAAPFRLMERWSLNQSSKRSKTRSSLARKSEEDDELGLVTPWHFRASAYHDSRFDLV